MSIEVVSIYFILKLNRRKSHQYRTTTNVNFGVTCPYAFHKLVNILLFIMPHIPVTQVTLIYTLRDFSSARFAIRQLEIIRKL